MKKLIMVLFFFSFLGISRAGNTKCDSLMKIIRDLNTKSNNFVNKYKGRIDIQAGETDRVVRGSSGDTSDARVIIGMYQKDTAFFHRCLDTVTLYMQIIKDRELEFNKACDNEISPKTFQQLTDQSDKTSVYVGGFKDFVEEIISDWEKKLRHTKKELDKLIEAYRKN